MALIEMELFAWDSNLDKFNCYIWDILAIFWFFEIQFLLWRILLEAETFCLGFEPRRWALSSSLLKHPSLERHSKFDYK